MHAFRFGLPVALPFVFLGACTVEDQPTIPQGEESDVVQEREPLYVASVPLFTTNNWQVPVCFTGGSQDARNAVRAAVQATWDEWTRLSFTGWGECPASAQSPIVPILLVPDNRNTQCGGGVTRPGVGGRLSAPNSAFQMRLNYCQDLHNLRATAVHEMGHAIGLWHEHERPDRTSEFAACQQALQAAYDGGLDLSQQQGGNYQTFYDSKSIMNYCRDFDGNGVIDLLEPGDDPWDLSLRDFHGIQQLYGWYDAGFDLPNAAFTFTDNTTAAGYQAGTAHNWNSWGYTPTTITRESTGTYRVDFPKVGAQAGNFQVSAFNSPNRCKIHSWGVSGSTMQLWVKCRTPGGSAANTQFTAKYVRHFEEVGWESAYVYANQETTASYTATGLYSFNSQDLSNRVTRLSTGRYRVAFPGQGEITGDNGTAEVTAVGTNGNYCSLLAQGNNDDGDLEVDVKCYTTSGTAADTRFMLSFSHRSLTGNHSFANVTSTSATMTHTPGAASQRSYQLLSCGSSAPGPAVITRLGTGRYEINFKGMWNSTNPNAYHLRTTVKVTARDPGGTGLYCNPMSWGVTGSDTKVNVNCYTATGVVADSRFTASLGTTYNGNCP